jgi:hypothetical protein
LKTKKARLKTNKDFLIFFQAALFFFKRSYFFSSLSPPPIRSPFVLEEGYRDRIAIQNGCLFQAQASEWLF